MRLTRFDRMVWIVIAALILLIAMVVFLGEQIGQNQARNGDRVLPAARQAEVIYLSPANDQASLWRTAAGNSAVLLSAPGQRVFDYALSSDGESVVYSALNSRGGLDLWQVDRDGKRSVLLVDCQMDRCSSPAWSADRNALAFARQGTAAGTNAVDNASQIWVYDFQKRVANPLFPPSAESQFSPSWSPDGTRIAFFEQPTGVIRIVDLLGGQEIQLPSDQSEAGSWSPDGSQMLFTNSNVTAEARPYTKIYLATLSNHQLTVLLGDDQNQMDYSVPVWTPDGKSMVFGSSLAGVGAARQLWLAKLDGSERVQITNANQYTHAAYHWDAKGESLVYQRYEQGKGGAAPEVVVWQRLTGEERFIAQNAFLPDWLP